MAWDIHGNDLKPGYCEVHPWVPEYYPCYLCEQDIERESKRVEEIDKYTEYINAEADNYYLEQYSEHLNAKYSDISKKFNKTH